MEHLTLNCGHEKFLLGPGIAKIYFLNTTHFVLTTKSKSRAQLRVYDLINPSHPIMLKSLCFTSNFYYKSARASPSSIFFQVGINIVLLEVDGRTGEQAHNEL